MSDKLEIINKCRELLLSFIERAGIGTSHVARERKQAEDVILCILPKRGPKFPIITVEVFETPENFLADGECHVSFWEHFKNHGNSQKRISGPNFAWVALKWAAFSTAFRSVEEAFVTLNKRAEKTWRDAE